MPVTTNPNDRAAIAAGAFYADHDGTLITVEIVTERRADGSIEETAVFHLDATEAEDLADALFALARDLRENTRFDLVWTDEAGCEHREGFNSREAADRAWHAKPASSDPCVVARDGTVLLAWKGDDTIHRK